MAAGSKYAALTKKLQECGEETITYTFAELQDIIEIPNYAHATRSAWANSANPSSLAAAWLNAGYIVKRGGVNLDEQWVVFEKGTAQPKSTEHKSINNSMNQNDVTQVIAYGKVFYDGIAADSNHRYLSWEHCHEAFKQHRQQQDEATIDYLCLHLAWYLASWGMLRNSFLMQKDYKIHAPIVKLLFEEQWSQLWDIEPEKMADEFYAKEIIRLCEAIKTAYAGLNAGIPTDTLLTKILLGTIGCVPAYDRYFKKAVSTTGAAKQNLTAKSIMMLGKLYVDNNREFEELRQHCSGRVIYPAAKILDMCFFEYGIRLGVEDEE